MENITSSNALVDLVLVLNKRSAYFVSITCITGPDIAAVVDGVRNNHE